MANVKEIQAILESSLRKSSCGTITKAVTRCNGKQLFIQQRHDELTFLYAEKDDEGDWDFESMYEVKSFKELLQIHGY